MKPTAVFAANRRARKGRNVTEDTLAAAEFMVRLAAASYSYTMMCNRAWCGSGCHAGVSSSTLGVACIRIGVRLMQQSENYGEGGTWIGNRKNVKCGTQHHNNLSAVAVCKVAMSPVASAVRRGMWRAVDGAFLSLPSLENKGVSDFFCAVLVSCGGTCD